MKCQLLHIVHVHSIPDIYIYITIAQAYISDLLVYVVHFDSKPHLVLLHVIPHFMI